MSITSKSTGGNRRGVHDRRLLPTFARSAFDTLFLFTFFILVYPLHFSPQRGVLLGTCILVAAWATTSIQAAFLISCFYTCILASNLRDKVELWPRGRLVLSM